MAGLTTPDYIAPEIVCELDDTPKVDIWAAGIILYQLVSSLTHPFTGKTPFGLMNSIREKEPAPLPSTVSPFMKELIGSLLNKNPENRPDAASLLIKDEIRAHFLRIIA